MTTTSLLSQKNQLQEETEMRLMKLKTLNDGLQYFHDWEEDHI